MGELERESKPRFDALDGVRASAMLAGVFYHAILFAMMGSGRMMMGPRGTSSLVQEYLHSFRMPLFFLISGFFCRMMLGKYGTRKYLIRRWSRIGVPLLMGLFLIVPVYQMTRSGMGPPPGMTGRGPGGPPPGMGEIPPPPAGFVPPPLARFDADADGSLSAEEWKKARESFTREGGPGPGGRGPMPFGPGGSEVGDRIFGRASPLFRLEYLWFLWYLLVFATAAPWLAKGLGWILGGVPERFSRGTIRLGLAPMGLGLVGGFALLLAPNLFGGWSLPLASGIFRGVPDFALHLEPDMPFYLAYFLTGWWLHREREGLSDVARIGLPCLLIGVVGHSASVAIHTASAGRTGDPWFGSIRLGGYLLYGMGSAYTAFGVLGLFQRHLNRPTRAGRYLSETALWVYLVHLPLLRPFLAAITPLGLPWWSEGILVAALTTSVALLLYEVVVRPTFLIRIFGPGRAARSREVPAVLVET